MSKKLADEATNKLFVDTNKQRLITISTNLLELSKAFDQVVLVVPDEKPRSTADIRKEAEKTLKERMENERGQDT